MVIEDPPDRPICAGCNEKLTWLYSARTQRWVDFVTLTDHRLKPHECDMRPFSRWAPSHVVAARTHRHMSRIRKQFGWSTRPIDDKETTRP